MNRKLSKEQTERGLKEVKNLEQYEAVMWVLEENLKELEQLVSELDTSGDSARRTGPNIAFQNFLIALTDIESIARETTQQITPVMVENGLSIQDAADAIGKNRQTVTRWRNSYRNEMLSELEPDYTDDNEFMDE